MEMVSRRVLIVKEERKMDSCGGVEEVEKKTGEESSLKSSSPNQRDSSTNNQVSTLIASERSSMNTSSKASPSNDKGPTAISNQEDQLESTKAEMGEVREENERLKTILARISKDYQSLQMHFFDIVQQEQAEKPPAPGHHVEEPDHLVSLSLGMNSSARKKEDKAINATSKNKENDPVDEGLTLGLDCKFEPASDTMSPSISMEERKEEPWPPSKILKNLRSGPEDEASQQAQVKKTRVSVRARCDAPTMHDGCQWRKYGQKIAKGNPCPRAYYRCTVAPACPVRKQVQRCAEDMSILITTYEGTHNHPLPISATAMASTTSAAACMLMSGSSTSRPPVISSSLLPSTAPSSNPNLNALNFNLIDPDSQSRPPFHLPNLAISSVPSYRTITLDLTSPPQPPSSHQASQFTRFSSSNFSTTTPARYSTSFDFSSSESNISTSLPTSWANGPYLSYASLPPYNKSPVCSLGLSASNQQDISLHQYSYLQNVANPIIGAPTQHVLTDTIAKAITSDPSFRSALATAITSYVGGGSNAAQNSVNGCGPSFLTRTESGLPSRTQQGISSLKFMQSAPLAFSGSKSASASPVENSENIN